MHPVFLSLVFYDLLVTGFWPMGAICQNHPCCFLKDILQSPWMLKVTRVFHREFQLLIFFGLSGSSGSGLCVSFKPFVAFLFGLWRLLQRTTSFFFIASFLELFFRVVATRKKRKTRETSDCFTVGTCKSGRFPWLFLFEITICFSFYV